jgi:hypothetical protein
MEYIRKHFGGEDSLFFRDLSSPHKKLKKNRGVGRQD